MFFNAKGFIMKGHDITGVKVTKTRIKNEAAASKTTLHFVSVDPSCPDSPEAYEGGLMDEQTVLRIRKKYKCDCKQFYQTGWCCDHVFATRGVLFGASPSAKSTSIGTRGKGRQLAKKRNCLEKDAAPAIDPTQQNKLKTFLQNFTTYPNRAMGKQAMVGYSTLVDGSNGKHSEESFYYGTVYAFHPSTKTWTVRFLDGDTTELNLHQVAKAVALADK